MDFTFTKTIIFGRVRLPFGGHFLLLYTKVMGIETYTHYARCKNNWISWEFLLLFLTEYNKDADDDGGKIKSLSTNRAMRMKGA